MSAVLNPPDAGAEDAALVARCRAGDATAWRDLVLRHQRLVDAIARRAGLDPASAADVFQEVFARLLRQIHALREPHRLRAWIVTTAKRETLHRCARARREVSLDALGDGDADGSAPLDRLADDGPLPDQLLDDLQQLDRLHVAFERLDERCRALIGALYREDPPPPYEELAARLSMPVGSVGPTRSRCLDRLRQLFAG